MLLLARDRGGCCKAAVEDEEEEGRTKACPSWWQPVVAARPRQQQSPMLDHGRILLRLLLLLLLLLLLGPVLSAARAQQAPLPPSIRPTPSLLLCRVLGSGNMAPFALRCEDMMMSTTPRSAIESVGCQTPKVQVTLKPRRATQTRPLDMHPALALGACSACV